MGLGELVLETLKGVVDYFVELGENFINWMKDGLRRFMYSLLLDDVEIVSEFMDKWMGKHPELADVWKKEKEKIEKGDTGAFALLGMLAGSFIGTGVGMGMSGFGRDIQNFFNTMRPVNPLPLDVLAYAKHTGMITDEQFKTDMLSHGFKEEYHQILYNNLKPHLTVGEILTAEKLLGSDKVDADTRLKHLGYNDDDINIMRELSWYYPSPTDFIRFAVRDVFTTDQKTKEALSAEFPEDIVEYAKKAGMREDVLKWYWMAHWELPSPTQVYEMLHRLNPEVLEIRGDAYKEMGLDVEQLKTDLETVKFYLKQADYDKRWRERLLAISYSPLTRVDLRRIYELGLIDDEELVARLMEVGYTKADALKLLEFYKSLKVSEEKDLTRSQILELFKIGEITEEECKSMLMEIGYDEVEADFLIAIEKYKENERIVNDLVSVYTTQFVEGLINEEELTQKLDELGLRASRRDKIITDAVRKKNRSIRLPSKEDILKWFNNKQITEEKARELLSRINIPEEFHDLYLGKKMK
ncbi:hypothetical protein DRN85_09475 [Methanosarcinales archaeon]|nr:MAG: hypothetical protein DRN85_09475 [Methanosarcinales archaeon]